MLSRSASAEVAPWAQQDPQYYSGGRGEGACVCAGGSDESRAGAGSM